MIPVAIVGASGYTGLELIKIIHAHPKFELAYLGTSEGGESLEALHPSLLGVIDLEVHKADAKSISQSCKLAFLALPHKTAMGFASQLLDRGVKVVDLSADYRLELETYEDHYCAHEDKKHLRDAVYGLPELYKDKIKNANLIANPGCYPTASILALAPFTSVIDPSFPIVIDAKSGVSGAGKKLNANTQFVTINENIFAYSPLIHRHQPEICEKLHKHSGKEFSIKFVPQLIAATRGMLVHCYVKLIQDIDATKILEEFYQASPFVRIRNNPTDIKSTSGTNFCDIYAQTDGDFLFITASIDNLLRGASSQAVVNANLMFGLDESLGIPNIAYAP